MGQNGSTQDGQTTEFITTKPPDEPPEPPERLSRNDIKLIAEGRVFTRYYIKKGVPYRSEALVSYHRPTKSICWASPDGIKYDPLHSMKLNDISKIYYGKHTPAFQTHLAADVPPHLCFSIVSDKLHRSIDLEASEETTVADFARAVDHVMEQAKTTPARWSLPSPPYQMPITQASLSRCLNASLIQYNQNLKITPKKIVRKSKSRKLVAKKISGDSGVSGKVKPSSLRGKPRVGSKRKTKCSPVLGALTMPSSCVLPDSPR